MIIVQAKAIPKDETSKNKIIKAAANLIEKSRRPKTPQLNRSPRSPKSLKSTQNDSQKKKVLYDLKDVKEDKKHVKETLLKIKRKSLKE